MSKRSSILWLFVLTIALILLWALRVPLNPEEEGLYKGIRKAQAILWTAMEKRKATDPLHDPWKSGFIGEEESATTTTLGSLEAKQNACDPLWGLQFLRWFDKLGLKAGDPVVIASSSSFPGMLYACLAACEERNLDIRLTVSLGASSWGANRPDAPWPFIAAILRAGGCLKTRAQFYTMGGEDENAVGMLPEGAAALEKAAKDAGIPLFRSGKLEDIIKRKMLMLEGSPAEGGRAKLLISIGGNESGLGRSYNVLHLANGLLLPGRALKAGNGLIGQALGLGFPVIHILNLKSLSARCGINFAKQRPFFGKRPIAVSIIALALFIILLLLYQRWSFFDKPFVNKREDHV